MKVSIITVCYNSATYIRTAIESVVGQDYPNIEYIVIDGGSTDGTLDILAEYRKQIAVLVSEPDKGIFDAMNKGLKLATGDIVATLNSDDIYTSSHVISDVVRSFEANDCEILYADLYYVREHDTNEVVRQWITKPHTQGAFYWGWHPPHPTFFARNELYKKYGYFIVEYKLATDFELMLRFIERYKAKTFYLNQVLVRMRLGGASNRSLRDTLVGNYLCYQSFKDNGLPVSILYPFFRLLPKLLQFLR